MKSDAWITYNDNFMQEYYKELTTSATYREAYEKIEARHFVIFDRNKFKNYEVFRSTLWRCLYKNRP
jgi:hypothetical protein